MENKSELKKMRSAAKKAVTGFVATATASCTVPIPVADAIVLVGEQVAMMSSVSAIYRLGLSKKTLQTLVMGALGASGASVVGKTIVSSAFKFIPGIGTVAGSVISSTTAGALTLALGNAFIELCEAVKKGELTEKDLEGKRGRDYFAKLFNSSKKEKEVTEMNFEKPKGQGFGDIIKTCDIVKDGEKGVLIWDQQVWNEITFYVAKKQKSESLYNCWSDKEAEKKFDELALKYKPTESEKREASLKKPQESEIPEILIEGLNKLGDMEPRSRMTLYIYSGKEYIGYIEITSNNERKRKMKEISISKEYRGKRICSYVIERVRSVYDIEISPEIVNAKQNLD